MRWAIIRSWLASAQAWYPVKISHLIVEATHIHMVLVVYNPDDVNGSSSTLNSNQLTCLLLEIPVIYK